MKSRISLKRTPERVELIKRMADANRAVALEAQQAFAEFIRPAVQKVLNQKSTASVIYRDLDYSKNDRPMIPIDQFLGTSEKHVSIWAQSIAGGLPTNLIQGLNEFTFQVYRLDSAVSFYNDYIKNANLPVLTAGIERMINEIVVKQERNAWSPLLAALATASTNSLDHVVTSTVAGVFQLEDLNKLFTRIDRIWSSYANGTPDLTIGSGLTDLFVSPEVIAQVRAFAYNPMNVRGGYKSDGTENTGTSVALPEGMRQEIFNAGGLLSIYDVNLHKLLELGRNAKYNTVFDGYYGGSFAPTTQEIVVGVDLSRDVFLRPVVTDDDNGGGQVVVRPDDQFYSRSEKTGFWAKVEEGRVILDDRALVGLIV
jgi:hypothetical protein